MERRRGMDASGLVSMIGNDDYLTMLSRRTTPSNKMWWSIHGTLPVDGGARETVVSNDNNVKKVAKPAFESGIIQSPARGHSNREFIGYSENHVYDRTQAVAKMMEITKQLQHELAVTLSSDEWAIGTTQRHYISQESEDAFKTGLENGGDKGATILGRSSGRTTWGGIGTNRQAAAETTTTTNTQQLFSWNDVNQTINE
jgi:hypothetical protein